MSQAPECTIQRSVGMSQVRVNWEGCSRNGVWHKILWWDIGLSGCYPCDCCKPCSERQECKSSSNRWEFAEPFSGISSSRLNSWKRAVNGCYCCRRNHRHGYLWLLLRCMSGCIAVGTVTTHRHTASCNKLSNCQHVDNINGLAHTHKTLLLSGWKVIFCYVAFRSQNCL